MSGNTAANGTTGGSRPVPFGAELDQGTDRIVPAGPRTERRLSSLRGLFADQDAWRRAVEEDDRLVYRVHAAPVPEERGEVPFSLTVLEPGLVGDEFFMTKGHWHTEEEGEVYIGVAGTGGVLLFDGTRCRWVDLKPGGMAYIPAGWAHRSVNVGTTPLKFLAVYPGAAGHDYETVERRGMGGRVLRDGDGFALDVDR